MQKVPVTALVELIEQLAPKHNLSDKVKNILLAQMRALKSTHGDYVPQDQAFEIIGSLMTMHKTGYSKQPVSIEEFVMSTEYLDLSSSIRPAVKEIVYELNTTAADKYLVILGGSIRWGKTYLVCIDMCYQLYKLSCLFSPQVHFNLGAGSEMLFVFQSVKEEKAKRNFREFKGMIENSPYFKNYFPPQGRSQNYLNFPHNIKVTPVPTSESANISENVFCGFLDELNFMNVVKKSAREGHEGGYFDQATVLYETMSSRIEHQFKNMATGELPGRIYLSSSAQHSNDFIEKRKQEAEKYDHIYIAHKSRWEALPKDELDKMSGKHFWIRLPTDQDAGELLDEKPSDMEGHIEVPIEYRMYFERNLHSALQDIAGVPIEMQSKFIPMETIFKNIREYERLYGSQQIFTTQEVNINNVISEQSVLNLPFLRVIRHYFKLSGHLDMAHNNDSAGLTLGAPVGSRSLDEEWVMNEETGLFERRDMNAAPIYALFGILRIKPPEGGEIDIAKVTNLLILIKAICPSFMSMTMDRAYSASIKQSLRKKGIGAEELSVDRNSDAYDELRTSAAQVRILMPEHETFKKEIKELIMDASTGKVDHLMGGTKDVADSVAGATYKMSKLKRSYKVVGKPRTFKEMEKMSEEKKVEKDEGRGTVSNRPKGNSLLY